MFLMKTFRSFSSSDWTGKPNYYEVVTQGKVGVSTQGFLLGFSALEVGKKSLP